MIKILRKDIFLTDNEYNKLNEFILNKTEYVRVYKKFTVSYGNNIFKFNINIEGTCDIINVSIANEPNPLIDNKALTWSSKKSFSALIGVYTINYVITLFNGKSFIYDFYFNINKGYNKENYSDKYDVLKNKQNITFLNIKNNHREAYNEIAYADFKNEEQLAFATYCILLNPYSLIYKDYAFNLYEEKLFYINKELENYSSEWEKYYLSQTKISVLKMHKYDILNLMISYIAYLKENYHCILNDNNKKEEVIKTGHYLYSCYINSI